MAGLPPSEAPGWLTDPRLPWRVANPLLLQAARKAVLTGRCAEALEWLTLRDANANRPAGRSPADHDATALYYRAIACSQLVRLKQAAEAAEALLALPPSETARRHRRLATLVLRDARRIDEKSLGFVAKLMGDSQRRLSLGRSGAEQQGLQQQIVDRLDKLIDELEQQQQQQQQQNQQQAADGQNPASGSQPMQQSRRAELKGPGQADGPAPPPSGDWGSLPPAERERVTQQVVRDFPGHYQRLIEEYFRSLASPASDDAKLPSEGANR